MRLRYYLLMKNGSSSLRAAKSVLDCYALYVCLLKCDDVNCTVSCVHTYVNGCEVAWPVHCVFLYGSMGVRHTPCFLWRGGPRTPIDLACGPLGRSIALATLPSTRSFLEFVLHEQHVVRMHKLSKMRVHLRTGTRGHCGSRYRSHSQLY